MSICLEDGGMCYLMQALSLKYCVFPLYPFPSRINWYLIPPYCTDVNVFASHRSANTSEIRTHACTQISRLPIVMATAAERQEGEI